MLIATAIAEKILGFSKDCLEFSVSLKNLGWRAAEARKLNISQDRFNDWFLLWDKNAIARCTKKEGERKHDPIKKKALSAYNQMQDQEKVIEAKLKSMAQRNRMQP